MPRIPHSKISSGLTLQSVRTPGSRGSNRSGFTLVEVMVAASVLLLSLGGSLYTLTKGYQLLDGARNDTLAAQILQSEIEQLRLYAWSDIVALDTAIKADPTKAIVDLTNIVSDPTLKSRFTNTTVSLAPITGRDMYAITVTVQWKGYDNLSHTRSFSTRYCKNGLYDYYYSIGHS